MSSRQPRILCVDENKDTCDLLKVAISRAGYETTTASTIGEAIAIAERESFDLFIVEKVFSDGNWLDLLRAVRSRTPKSCFVLYSSDPYDPTFKEAMAAGADAHLISDGNIHSLIWAVHDLISSLESAQ